MRIRLYCALLTALLLSAAGSAATAAEDGGKSLTAAALEAVAAKVKGARAKDLRATPIPGIYEYRRGSELAYVTEDGRYAFAGDLYQMSNNSNLSDVRRRELRLALLKATPESSMLVFAPEQKAKYTITVFTDVDCTYCQRLHRQIADYNRLGIKVRYLAFPRTGPNTESWNKAEQVWCSEDRKDALTRAKLGEPLSAKVCNPNPVASQYALGKSMGVSGTPTIIMDSGDVLAGYLPPDTMVQQLQLDAQDAKTAQR